MKSMRGAPAVGHEPTVATGSFLEPHWGMPAAVTLKAVRFNCFDHPMLKREVCGGNFEAAVKRSLFGVNYGLQMGMANDTKVIIQVEAVKQ